MHHPRRFASALLLCALTALPLAAQRPIKVFISVDMEGIGGVVTADQLSPAGFEYAKFREYMTAEALAAIAGAREAGATEFVVADAHGNMQYFITTLDYDNKGLRTLCHDRCTIRP